MQEELELRMKVFCDGTKVKVGERALLARLNRAFAKEGRVVKKCRPDTRGHSDLGDYYLVDTSLNAVLATHVDLQTAGREIGVIAPHEELATLDELQVDFTKALEALRDNAVSPREAARRLQAMKAEQDPGSEDAKRTAAAIRLANAMSRLDRIQEEYEKLRRENPAMPRISLFGGDEGL